MKKIFFILLFSPNIIFCQPVLLDPTFGISGITVTPNTFDINAFGFDNSSDIISVGIKENTPGVYNTIVTKHNNNGVLDITFGNSGIASLLIGDSSMANAVAIQPDNKIVICGRYQQTLYTTPYKSFMARFNHNGVLDITFGTNGIIDMAAYPSFKSLYSIAILPDGKIIFGGQIDNHNTGFVKTNSDGSFDNLFGTNGIKLMQIPNFDFSLYKMLLLNDNNLLCLGSDFTSFATDSTQKMACCKMDQQCNLIPTFGIGGKVVIDYLNGSFASLFDAKEYNNQIIIGGYTNGSILLKINSNGTIDTSFGTTGLGYLVHSYPSQSTIELQPDGKILIAGGIEIAPYNFGTKITRFTNNGSLDTTFNNSGFINLDLSTGSDYLFNLIMQNNKLIIGGASHINPTTNFTLARLDLGLPLSVSENAISNDATIVYPNPVKNILNLTNKNNMEISSISIFNTLGQLVQTITNPNTTNDVSGLKTGTYFVKISTDKGFTNSKFVKE